MFDVRELSPEAPRLFTRAEFQKLAATDIFDDDERIELIRGVIVRVTPPLADPSHDAVIQRLTRILVLSVGERGWVRPNIGFGAGDDSLTIPDLAVVPPGDYDDAIPERAWLLVEVSLSSLRKDRNIKAPLYAECGVAEYWVVDVRGRTIEVHTDPTASGAAAEHPKGWYGTVRRFARGEKIRLVSLPDVEISVDDIVR